MDILYISHYNKDTRENIWLYFFSSFAFSDSSV
jgi:hypothetical protein